jgi:ParB family chromosome partitioning protein
MNLKETLAKKIAENSQRHAAADQESEFDAGSQHIIAALSQIDPNPYQPRLTFNDKSLEELATSISVSGLLQPIILRPHGDRYQIVAGERRYKAHKILGRSSISAIIKKTSDADMAVSGLAENLKREDLTDFEISRALKQIDNLFPTKKKLAESLGINREDMYRYYAFDSLPNFITSTLELTPNLLSRAAASEIKRVLQSRNHDKEVLSLLEESWKLLESKALEQTKIAGYIERKYGKSEKELIEKPEIIPLMNGFNKMEVGSISSSGKKFIIKIKKNAITEAQATRLKEFLKNLISESV